VLRVKENKMNAKPVLLSGVVALAVALVTVLGLASLDSDSVQTVREIVKETKEQVGASPGPDLFVPYLGVNGVKRYYNQVVMLTGTTTPCAIKSPSATSTLVSAVAHFDSATTTGAIGLRVNMARAATAFATTTSIGGRFDIPSGGAGAPMGGLFTMVASTTDATTTPVFFTPNQFFVLGVAFSAGQGANMSSQAVGQCNATFEAVE